MDHDDHTETRFLAVFYGVLGLIVAAGTFAMLAGAHLTSLVAIVVPLFVAMALLWFGVPHGGQHSH